MAQKIIESKLLPPNSKSIIQSFSPSRKVASEFGKRLHIKSNQVCLLVSAKPSKDKILFGMTDLQKSSNNEVGSWILALEDWYHQNEVIVHIDTPLTLLSADII